MQREFNNRTPLARLAFAVLALCATLSVGGFIDLLATGYSTADSQQRAALIAERRP
jgi:hypothetical protein